MPTALIVQDTQVILNYMKEPGDGRGARSQRSLRGFVRERRYRLVLASGSAQADREGGQVLDQAFEAVGSDAFRASSNSRCAPSRPKRR